MFRRLYFALSLALILLPSIAQASIVEGGWIEFGSGRYRQSGFNGGEFAIYEKNDRSTPLAYSFCIEYYENIKLDGTDYYIADISKRAVKGGDESGTGPGPNDGLKGDPISFATDFLFSNFMSGGLDKTGGYSGFAYNDYWGRRTQEAIWLLEEEREEWQVGGNSSARADSVALKNWALSNAGDSYSGDVFVLNLFTKDVGIIDADNYNTWKDIYKTKFVQDQLWYNPGPDDHHEPVPEPATIAIWSVLGLGGIGFGIRRARKNRKTAA